MTFADKGSVADIDPAFFVGYLYRVKATGTLKFEDAPIQRAIYFRDGRVLFSSSNAPEDQLGAILVAAGKIEQDQFDLVVATLEPKQSIAAALAQGGHVSQRDIGEAARRKVEQIIGSCCAQTSGRYEFEDGVLPKGALDLKLTTEKVLISAFEALEPSGFLIRILKSPMAVLAQGETVPTDPDLARLRESLDGVSSLADIGGMVGLPLAATEVRAGVLVVMGAATVVTSQIEEMSLPDTGETTPSLPAMSLSEESQTSGLEPTDEEEAVEAETIGFAPGLSAMEPESPGDSTLTMDVEEAGGFAGSNEATVMLDSGSGVPPPLARAQGGSSRSDRPRGERATTQDLDAVKELLGAPPSRPSPPPAPSRPGSASIPSQRWEPRLSSPGRSSRGRGGLASVFENPLVKTLAAVILTLTVVAVGWFAYTGNQSLGGADHAPPPPPSPSASVQTAAADPSDGALLPVPPAATTPVPIPSPTSASTPAPTPQPTPQPTRSAPTPPTAPAQTPRPAPASGAATSADAAAAYATLKSGRFNEAATAFVGVAGTHAGEFSVQILVACSPQTIEKALQNDASPELFVLPTAVQGKACYRLMRGFFSTSAEATRSVSSFPRYYSVEGARPRAVAVKDILP